MKVFRVAGMEVLNKAIESIKNSTDQDDWERTVIHVTDNVLSLWKGQVLSSVHT